MQEKNYRNKTNKIEDKKNYDNKNNMNYIQKKIRKINSKYYTKRLYARTIKLSEWIFNWF